MDGNQAEVLREARQQVIRPPEVLQVMVASLPAEVLQLAMLVSPLPDGLYRRALVVHRGDCRDLRQVYRAVMCFRSKLLLLLHLLHRPRRGKP